MARKLIVEIVGDTRNLERSFGRASKASSSFSKELERTIRGGVAGTGVFNSLGRSVAFASSAFLGGAGLVAVLKQSIEEASNLEESMSKTEVVFGTSAGAVEEWSKTMAKSFGVSEQAALETASSFGALFAPIQIVGKQSADLSIKLVELGSDLAAFKNVPVADALDAIQSGLTGQVRPLRRFGVLLSEARVQQVALRQSGKDSVKELTNQEKVLARIAIIFHDTAKAQGNFSLTSADLAQQEKIATANIEELQTALGQQLTPKVTEIVTKFNDWIGKSENQKRVLDDVRQAGEVLSDVLNTLKGAMEILNEVTGSTKRSLELLLIAFAGFKAAKLVGAVARLAGAITGIGAEATVATGEVAALEGGLAGLAAIGPIVIPIALVASGAFGLKKLMDHLAGGLPGGRRGGPTGVDPNDPSTWTDEQVAAAAAALPNTKNADYYLHHRNEGLAVIQAGGGGARLRGFEPGATGGGGDFRTPTPRGGGGGGGTRRPPLDTTLSAAQRRAIALAGDAGLPALRAQQAYDQAALAFLEKRFQAGKISAKKYAEAVVKFKNDLAQQTAAIESITSAASAATKKALEASARAANEIKSAILDQLDRLATRIQNQRELRDALNELRIARLIGGPQGTKLAQERLTLAQLAIRRAQVEAAEPTVRGGRFRLGNIITINVHGNEDPELVAKKVVAILRHGDRNGTAQTRGPSAGTHAGSR